MTEDQYRSLATDYHWYFDDVALFLGSDTPGVRAAMSSLQPGARVLDAACGIGVDAAALARRGFNVDRLRREHRDGRRDPAPPPSRRRRSG